MPTKFKVRIARSAERDIEEIWSYIAADSPDRAREFVHQLEIQALTLERFPVRCPQIPENELLGTEYRHLLHGQYRTLFRVSGKVVFVLRIIHGSKLLDASMFESQL